MAEQELTKRGHAGLTLSRHNEDDRLVPAIHVDEHGNVIVAALGSGLVKADRA